MEGHCWASKHNSSKSSSESQLNSLLLDYFEPHDAWEFCQDFVCVFKLWLSTILFSHLLLLRLSISFSSIVWSEKSDPDDNTYSWCSYQKTKILRWSLEDSYPWWRKYQFFFGQTPVVLFICILLATSSFSTSVYCLQPSK